MRVRPLCLFLLLAVPTVQADEKLRATQEELRRRNLFFGDVDGRETNELGEALKRYQRRKGFASTGHTDPVTLRSLGLLPRDPNQPAPHELSLPDEPVLKSDIKISPEAEARAVSQETGIALGALNPIAEKAPANRLVEGGLNATATAGRLETAPAMRGVGMRPGPGGTRPLTLQPAQIEPLLRGYLRASSKDDTRAELRYLADRVAYLGHGVLDRRVIEHTLHAYNLRWPSRSYKLAGPVQYTRDPRGGVITVSFPVDFELKRGKVTARGRVLNRLFFDAATSDPRIIGIQEQRMRTR